MTYKNDPEYLKCIEYTTLLISRAAECLKDRNVKAAVINYFAAGDQLIKRIAVIKKPDFKYGLVQGKGEEINGGVEDDWTEVKSSKKPTASKPTAPKPAAPKPAAPQPATSQSATSQPGAPGTLWAKRSEPKNYEPELNELNHRIEYIYNILKTLRQSSAQLPCENYGQIREIKKGDVIKGYKELFGNPQYDRKQSIIIGDPYIWEINDRDTDAHAEDKYKFIYDMIIYMIEKLEHRGPIILVRKGELNIGKRNATAADNYSRIDEDVSKYIAASSLRDIKSFVTIKVLIQNTLHDRVIYFGQTGRRTVLISGYGLNIFNVKNADEFIAYRSTYIATHLLK